MTEDTKTTQNVTTELRAQMDAAEYKHIVLGLIFLKYISDKFGAQQEKIKQMVSDPSSDYFISEDPDDYQSELEERDYYIQDSIVLGSTGRSLGKTACSSEAIRHRFNHR